MNNFVHVNDVSSNVSCYRQCPQIKLCKSLLIWLFSSSRYHSSESSL